jgi:hypothetical protein
VVTEDWALIAVCIACLAAVWTAARIVRERRVDVDDWMPRELKDHSLAYSERTFRSGGDTTVVARVDRAYRSPRGLITLVELKTRAADRVHQSDIIELSAQRVALAGETAEPVALIGWVVVQTNAGRVVHRVRLMSPDAVQRLASRRDALLAGSVLPGYPATTGLCTSCAYRRRCHQQTGRL